MSNNVPRHVSELLQQGKLVPDCSEMVLAPYMAVDKWRGQPMPRHGTWVRRTRVQNPYLCEPKFCTQASWIKSFLMTQLIEKFAEASASSFSINRLHSWHLRELHGLQDAAFNRAKLQIWGSHGAEMKHVLHCYNVTTCQRISNCRLSLFLVNIMCEMWCEIWLNWCVFISGEIMFEMMWVMVMMYDTWNDGWKSDVKMKESGGLRNGGEKSEQQTYLQGHCLLFELCCWKCVR